MTSPDRPGTEPEAKENELESYNYGIQSYELVSILTRKQSRPFEAQAYIQSRGLVLITNQGTMNSEPKIRDGNNRRMIPDELVYFTLDTFRELAGESEIHCTLRKPITSKAPPSLEAQRMTRRDIETILRKKGRTK